MKVLGRKGKPAAPACQLPAVRGAFSAVSPPCERKKSGKDAGSTALVQAANRLCSSFPARFIFLAFGAVSEGCPKKEEPHPAPLIPPLQQTHRFLPVSSLTQPHLSPPLPRCHFRARWRGWQEGCPHCLCRDSAPGGKDARGREGRREGCPRCPTPSPPSLGWPWPASFSLHHPCRAQADRTARYPGRKCCRILDPIGSMRGQLGPNCFFFPRAA